jgi:hypothetical protein
MTTPRPRIRRPTLATAGWLLALLASAGCGGRPPPPALEIRAAPATRKITRTEPISTWSNAIHLAALRNEYEAFQVVVRAQGREVRDIHVECSDLVSADTGHTLPASACSFFREYFIPVLQPTGGYPWMPRIEYPDPLLPFRHPGNGAPYGAPFDNVRIGSVGQPFRAGRTASGSAFPVGVYTARGDRAWVVQMERSGDAGQVTFRWSDSWKSGWDDQTQVRRWNREHLAIPQVPPGQRRTQPIPLADGVSVVFGGGRTPQFEAGQTFHFSTYDAMNEVVWGEICIPPDTPAGRYSGTITVTLADQAPHEMPLSLEVWNATLPRDKTITTAFGGWMESAFYSGNPDANWQFEELLHEHRIDTQTIMGHRTEWQGRYGNIDWSAFNAAAEPRLSGAAYADGVPMNRFHLAMYSCGYDHLWTRAAQRDETNVAFYGKLFAEHLKRRGWFDRVYMYCRDEPQPQDLPAIIRDIQAFLRGDPDWRGRFMVTSFPTLDHPLLDWIDIWCVKYHWGLDPAVRERLRADGRRLWCYVANTPHAPNPTYHIDSIRGYEPRLIKWAAWKLGAEGFLHWAMALDQEYPNPWTTAMNDFGACGDANFIYYGARNGPRLNDQATPLPPRMGPVPSFRLKQIRDGLEDWELLRLCEQKMGRAWTEALVSEVYRGTPGVYGRRMSRRQLEGYWTQDDGRIDATRRKLVSALIEAP